MAPPSDRPALKALMTRSIATAPALFMLLALTAAPAAADTLREAARPLRRADMNDQIDIAPVDPEIERRGRDHSAQGVGGHGLLDLAALARIE